MSTLSHILRHGRPAAMAVATLASAAIASAAFAIVAFVRSAFLIGALANVAPVNVTAAQAQPSPLRLSLDWRLEGPTAMFLVAQDRGYFREEGLDVAVDEGATPLDPVSRVASGSHDFGFADINALMKYRDQHPNAPIKAVFMVYNKPPYSIVSRKSRGVNEPKQLEGKKLGIPSNGNSLGEWPLFAKLNDIDASKVAVEQIGIPVRVPMLAAGQIDATLGPSFRVYVDLKDRGVAVDDIVLLPMANYGVQLYGNAIIVNSKLAADRPEAVSAFLRASLHGLRDAIRNPGSAVDTLLKRDEGLKKEVEVERLRMAIRDNLVTPEVRANGFGAVDNARLEEAISQLATTYTFKTRPKAEAIFDPSFLAPLADRRAN
jgi:NitT/TauT family transport system substrate-binding protein